MRLNNFYNGNELMILSGDNSIELTILGLIGNACFWLEDRETEESYKSYLSALYLLDKHNLCVWSLTDKISKDFTEYVYNCLGSFDDGMEYIIEYNDRVAKNSFNEFLKEIL